MEWYNPILPSVLMYVGELYDITNGRRKFLLRVDANSHTMPPSLFMSTLASENERKLRVNDYFNLKKYTWCNNNITLSVEHFFSFIYYIFSKK